MRANRAGWPSAKESEVNQMPPKNQAGVQRLRRVMKFGPKLSREGTVEFLLSEIGAPPRKLSPLTLEKLRRELARHSAPDQPPHIQRWAKELGRRLEGSGNP
jgi:hypothetical protein